jgi:tetrapyrrole methylase family protein/MazG family protein
MATITIAGLGPGRRGLRTLETVEAIDAASTIVLRTAIHPGVDDLIADRRVVACDDIYETSESFDEVYRRIAERVLSLASTGDVLYLAPGHPRYGENVTVTIEQGAIEQGHAVSVLSAVSALDEIATSLDVDLMRSEFQSLDATSLASSLERDPFASGLTDVSPFRPLLVTQVFSREMASATKLAMTRLYGDEHMVTVVRGAGVDGERIEKIPLHRLDRTPVDHLTSVWFDPVPEVSAAPTFSALLRIVARLRAPGGCPWDQKQDARSLVHSLIEEAYEAVEAIEADDAAHTAEELGDILLLIAMQAQIAEEEGLFQIEDALSSITAKLIRRHPHVFGEHVAESADDVVGIWQQVKATEGKKPKPRHPLDRYPVPMPVAQRLIDYYTGTGSSIAEVPDDLGQQLFDATRIAIQAGFNPEKLMLDAARRAIPEDPAG